MSIARITLFEKLKQPLLTILAPLYALGPVYKDKQQPRFAHLHYSRNNIRLLGIYPDKEALENKFYRFHTAAVVLLLTTFWATLAGGLYKAGKDIIAFGESLMFLAAVTIVYVKTLLGLKNFKKLNEIIQILEELNEDLFVSRNEKVKQLQRLYFIAEVCMFSAFGLMSIMLFLNLSSQPLLTDQSTPLPALFPFNLQDSKFAYAFQVFSIFYSLLVILCFDSTGINCITQTSLHLKVLAVKLRYLGLEQNNVSNLLQDLKALVEYHQKIIEINSRCNDAFNGSYIVQMGANSFMFGLAGFEALLSKDEPIVAFKFLLFMFIATSHLFFYCLLGNMAYYDSLDVAVAGFEAHEWFTQSPTFQRNLMFLIMRAQKPLEFRAKTFLSFTFETFNKIIKTSYSAFTLLCNTSK